MKKLDELIEVFGKLPGIGKKSAMRIAFDILEKNEIEIENMLSTIKDAYTSIKHCSICGNLCEGEICEICSSEKRDKSVICIVESVKDVIAFEKSETYNGLYHVLGGKIDPLNGVTIEDLNISELMKRLDEKDVEEVILALNPDMEGETTALYLIKMMKNKGVKVSQIASGIPMGGNIEFTDMATLGRSLEGRREIE
ncbi:recombination protein RecR [Leptotrichia sp. oral taxon 215 str. W9775]|jgi:recombination protein recR|uniref:recombination mediator RecR n=1 Tax=Leptotrichia sp. oral taxon 215 TaxID=712359 RepID=UPI0003AE6A1B|nr:recombination mediator RecR [Leptotrichia sp. oral taxon 215]ERK68307.1 recombination protein RecR [Leptotrichia sp. oral taxon 215 str. W9775]MBF1335979.1 recombination protein RecR [Leptotrichia sp.]